MPALFRRNLRILLALVLLGAGTLMWLSTDDAQAPDVSAGPYAVLDAPAFTARLTRGKLVLTGTTASANHEVRLMRVVADQFADQAAETEFRPGILLPDHWIPASMRLLYLLAATDSATAVMHEREITVRGLTSDAATFASRLEFLREAMPTNALITDDMVVVSDSATLDTLCRAAFAGMRNLKVEFRQSSTEIRTSSFSNLDRIVDFAYDCRHLTIAITGHSDSSGDESWNRRLSRARAQAVADYLMRSGVSADQLLVDGRGSSMPIADNDTLLGRSLNRRIEFALAEPSL